MSRRMLSEKQIAAAFARHCMVPNCVYCIYREGKCRDRYTRDLAEGRITLAQSFKRKKTFHEPSEC